MITIHQEELKLSREEFGSYGYTGDHRITEILLKLEYRYNKKVRVTETIAHISKRLLSPNKVHSYFTIYVQNGESKEALFVSKVMGFTEVAEVYAYLCGLHHGFCSIDTKVS